MNHDKIRQEVALSLEASDPSSNRFSTLSFEDFLNSRRKMPKIADKFSSSPVALRLVNASLSVISSLIFHPTVTYSEFSDAVPSQNIPSFITRRRNNNLKAKGDPNQFVMVRYSKLI